jgi:nucleotide-binding universal stress UspA family protein
MTEPLYATIVVPTDLSEPSRPAVRHAAELADRIGARIVLVYVMEDRLPAMILAHTNQSEQEILDQHRRVARASLEAMAGELLPGRDVECVVRQGASHALAGSTTERVLHHAPCPVLVVGPAGRPD